MRIPPISSIRSGQTCSSFLDRARPRIRAPKMNCSWLLLPLLLLVLQDDRHSLFVVVERIRAPVVAEEILIEAEDGRSCPRRSIGDRSSPPWGVLGDDSHLHLLLHRLARGTSVLRHHARPSQDLVVEIAALRPRGASSRAPARLPCSAVPSRSALAPRTCSRCSRLLEKALQPAANQPTHDKVEQLRSYLRTSGHVIQGRLPVPILLELLHLRVVLWGPAREATW